MELQRTVMSAVLVGACGALPVGAAAETLFGTLSGRAGAKATLQLTCDRAVAHAAADAAGSYRITVAGRGRCHLQVGNMPPPGELVFVYAEPTRYDYEVSTVNGLAHIERR